MLTKQPRVWHL